MIFFIIGIRKNFFLKVRDISALKNKQGEIHENFSRLLHKSDFRPSDTIDPTIFTSNLFHN